MVSYDGLVGSGRRSNGLTTCGQDCESILLTLSRVDPTQPMQGTDQPLHVTTVDAKRIGRPGQVCPIFIPSEANSASQSKRRVHHAILENKKLHQSLRR